MVGDYPIFMAGEESGRAVVTQEGMFWRIRCRCNLSADIPCTVQARWGEKIIDLGLCAKEGDSIGLTARLNRKTVPAGKPVFCIAVKHRQSLESFIPICPQEPFAYIAKLKYAYLVNKAGKLGIAVRDQNDNVSPTGQ